MNRAAKYVRELESKHKKNKTLEDIDIELGREVMAVGWNEFGSFTTLGFYNRGVWEWTKDATTRYDEVALHRVGAFLI